MKKNPLDFSGERHMAEALLEAARDDHDPSELERAAVRRGLAARIAQLEAATPAAQSAPIAPQLKLWIAGGCVALAALGTLLVTRKPAPQPQQEPPRLSAPHPEPEPEPAPRATPTPRNEPTPVHAHMKSTPRVRTSPPPARRIAPSELIAAPVEIPESPRIASSEPTLAPAENPITPRALEAPTPPPSHSERRAEPPSEPRPTELALMQRIQSALRTGDPRLALALSVEHEQRWPRGQFQQEREGVRAFASCQLELSEGRARASAFLARYPDSALAPRVRKACRLLMQ